MQNKKTVVLVGSTGNGKSTLASFLFDAEKYEDKPKFPRANSSQPTTQHVEFAEMAHSGSETSFVIVDTPGLNENARKDMEHMVEVLKVVRAFNEIAAVLICHKINEKMDEQFINTIKYYTDFFSPFKDRNIIIILTNVAIDSKSIRKRKLDGFDVEATAKTVSEKVRFIANLKYTPMILCIDANPLYEPLDKEYETAVKTRDQLLLYISQLSPLNTKHIMFRKTKFMIEEDEVKIQVDTTKHLIKFLESIKGSMAGYAASIRDSQLPEKKVLGEINVTINEIASLELVQKKVFFIIPKS
jgi:predicted GTPase